MPMNKIYQYQRNQLFFQNLRIVYCGPNDDIIIPKDSKHTDWEVEIGFVIGKKALMSVKIKR